MVDEDVVGAVDVDVVVAGTVAVVVDWPAVELDAVEVVDVVGVGELQVE